jgi:hypothetical protein
MFRVLYLHSSPYKGGARVAHERLSSFMAEHSQEMGIQFTPIDLRVFARRAESAREILAFGFYRLLNAFASRLCGAGIAYTNTPVRIAGLIDKVNPDLVVVSMGTHDFTGIKNILSLDVPRLFITLGSRLGHSGLTRAKLRRFLAGSSKGY